MYSLHSQQQGHSQTCKLGIIITNLGSPSAPTPKALKRYLAEFLADPRVVETPRWLWWCILNGIILNIRPRRSAKAYAKVWTDHGSPLTHTMSELTVALRISLAKKFQQGDNLNFVVDFAMRYGEPSIEETMVRLQNQGVQRFIVLPLYPQYSASTTASTFDEFARVMSHLRWQPSLDFLPAYYDNPHFVHSIATSIQQFRQQNGSGELLVFSYHGVPQRYLHKGDPYHCQCLKTSRLIVDILGLEDTQHKTYFQSRFGREPWLQPYMDKSLVKLAEQGYKKIDIICPGFSIDCLETLEEVQMEARQEFIDAGGESLNYIPCLNASFNHVQLIERLLESHIESHLSQLNAPEKQRLAEDIIQKLVQKSPNAAKDTPNLVASSAAGPVISKVEKP